MEKLGKHFIGIYDFLGEKNLKFISNKLAKMAINWH